MKFQVIFREASGKAQSPVRIVEQSTGHEIGWANRYLDREYVRRSADKTLQAYAYNLLHFVRWWASIHHTGDVAKGDLTEATLSDYVRFQSGLEPAPSGATSTTALGSSIVLFAASFPMRLVKSPLAFIIVTCGDHPWGSPGRAW
jgi:hypothetical protein